jgi:hypothetical protein
MMNSAQPPLADGERHQQLLRRERATGLTILGAAFVVALIVSWLVKRAVHTAPEEALSPPSREGLSGFPERFAALSALQRAREMSSRSGLFGIVLQGVRSDGTQQLAGGPVKSSARFVFGSRRGEGPQKPVPPGERRRRDQCGRQEVIVDEAGIYAMPDDDEHDCKGLKGRLPDPTCEPVQVWKRAMEHGIPADLPAQLEYYQAKAGPAWRLRIPDTSHEFVLYGDCEQQLQGSEAAGKVP